MILLVPHLKGPRSGCGQTWKQTHNLNKTRRRNNTPVHEHIIEDEENYTQCRKRRRTQALGLGGGRTVKGRRTCRVLEARKTAHNKARKQHCSEAI